MWVVVTAMDVAGPEYDGGMTDDEDERDDVILGVGLALLLARMRRKRKVVEFVRPRRQFDGDKCMWTKYTTHSGPDGHSDETSPAGKRFRRRFRVPWTMYRWIVDRINADDNLRDLRTPVDATKRPGIPVDILVLASLRILGRYPHYEDELSGMYPIWG